MPPPKTVTIDSFPDSAFRHIEADAIVCIDVMLSGTTLVTAAAQGRRAFIAGGEAEARRRAAALPDNACLMGAQDGQPLEGSELVDSPTDLLRQPVNRPLVLCSPPGTDLIVNASACRRVLVASFRNLSSTARQLATHHRVALLGAGCREEFSCEDQMAAAWIAVRLAREGFEADDRRTAALIQRWSSIEPALAAWGNSAEALRRGGRADDLDFVLRHVDDLALACLYRSGEVIPQPQGPSDPSELPGPPRGQVLAAGAPSTEPGPTP